MTQRQADLAVVRKMVLAQGSDDGGALQMMAEGLPFAVPVLSAVGEGAMAEAAHKFQARFVGHIVQCFQEAKQRAQGDKAAAEAKIEEAGAELGERRATADQAGGEVDEAIAQVDAKKAHVKELEAAAAKAQVDQMEWEVQGERRQEEWAKLRQLHAEAEAVDEGPLTLLEGEEADEVARSAAVSTVAKYLADQNADKVLQSSAPYALAVTPSARSKFDRLATEAVANLVKKRVAELGAELARIAPEERVLRAEIGGLWAISDCARDAVLATQEELFHAEVLLGKGRSAHEEALERVQVQEEAGQSHEAAKAGASAKEQQLADASLALARLARPAADKAEDVIVVLAEEEVGEPEAKRQRLDVAGEASFE